MCVCVCDVVSVFARLYLVRETALFTVRRMEPGSVNATDTSDRSTTTPPFPLDHVNMVHAVVAHRGEVGEL